MAGYFSFSRFITNPFVKAVYFLGFIALTSAGIVLAVWAGLRLYWATIPTQQGVYYIAVGFGTLIVGNLAWRMMCELWIVLFNIHARLVSIDRGLNQPGVPLEEPEVSRREVRQVKVQTETNSETDRPEQSPYGATRPASVLGLSG